MRSIPFYKDTWYRHSGFLRLWKLIAPGEGEHETELREPVENDDEPRLG